MQHYIKYGLCIDPKHLTEEEIQYIWNNGQETHKTIGLEFFPFTEDYEGKNWGTVVVKSFGELPHAGKRATYQEIKKLCAQEEIITKADRELIEKKFKEYNIEHLIDKVEVMVFSKCY